MAGQHLDDRPADPGCGAVTMARFPSRSRSIARPLFMTCQVRRALAAGAENGWRSGSHWAIAGGPNTAPSCDEAVDFKF
jgi:hypothetical protein